MKPQLHNSLEDNDLATAFDAWFAGLSYEHKTTVETHLARLVRIKNMGMVGAKALLAVLYPIVYRNIRKG